MVTVHCFGWKNCLIQDTHHLNTFVDFAIDCFVYRNMIIEKIRNILQSNLDSCKSKLVTMSLLKIQSPLCYIQIANSLRNISLLLKLKRLCHLCERIASRGS